MTRHKWSVKDGTELLSSDWSKITFYFSYPRSSRNGITSFFLRSGSPLGPQDRSLLVLALYLSFKFIRDYLGVQPPYRGPQSRSAWPLLFVPDPSWQSPRSASLPFPTLGIHIECVPKFPFLHHISCMRESFALLILCSMYCRLICPFKSPTNILQCFLFSLRMNWTYLSVSPSRDSWLIPYFSQTLYLSVSFFQSNFLFWT